MTSVVLLEGMRRSADMIGAGVRCLNVLGRIVSVLKDRFELNHIPLQNCTEETGELLSSLSPHQKSPMTVAI